MHAFTYTHISSIHSLVKDRQRGFAHQQHWCSADPRAVGLTHVAGQTERELNRIRTERGEEGKLSYLIYLLADLRSNRVTQAISIKPLQPLQLMMVSGHLAWIYYRGIIIEMSST